MGGREGGREGGWEGGERGREGGREGEREREREGGREGDKLMLVIGRERQANDISGGCKLFAPPPLREGERSH